MEAKSPTSYSVSEVAGFLSRTLNRMYCRNCHYDLRGQENLRCPECGEGFDSEDAGTFLEAPPRSFTVQELLRSGRVTVAVLLGIAVLSVCFPSRSMDHQRRGLTSVMIFDRCLGKITDTWRDQQLKHALPIDFDRDTAIGALEPNYDGKDEYMHQRYGQGRFRLRMSNLVHIVVPVAIYVSILLWLWRHRLRIPFAIALVVSTIALAANEWSGEIYRFIHPPSYSYLDDYIFFEGVNLLDPVQGTVAGYEVVPWRPDYPRLVVFAERRLENLYDDEFLPILEAQGLKLDQNAEPSPRPPKQN